MVLGQFNFAARYGGVGFSCYDPQMGQSGCELLVLLDTGVPRSVYHYSILSFVLVCTFDATLACFEYRWTAGID